MINLFEYQNKASASSSLDELELFLDDIWRNREKSGFYYQEQENRVEVQQFIQILHRTRELKSNKYVGVIHFHEQRINLLPKIFYREGTESDGQSIEAIHTHILWWLSYCRKLKFPNYQTTLGDRKNDFFEVLIYLFAKYTRNLLASSIYQQYEEVCKELPYIKGRLNSSAYINENISRGRWHKLNCTYDAFVFDNQFNQIIKYVTTLLFNATRNIENKKFLREILFILDDVSDRRATAEECHNIQFNPMFDNFVTVRDYCFLFLNNCISFDFKNDLKLFAFLLPMEYVFEDFIFGFIDKEIESISAKAQNQSVKLDNEGTFTMKPDLLLMARNRLIIADTKYKIIYSEEIDPKRGISQSDIYQMIAYAIRYDVDNIVLMYPDTITGESLQTKRLIIEDTMADCKEIRVWIHQVPVINRELFQVGAVLDRSYSELFVKTKEKLNQRISAIFI
jgi:5-methylcytosine-specific restriction enzyme subunit McrC